MNFDIDNHLEFELLHAPRHNDDGSETITFCVRDEPYSTIVEGPTLLLSFDLDADMATHVRKEELDSFWLRLSDVEERKRGNIRNPAIQVLHQWMVVCMTGRIDSNNINNTDMWWLYNAIVSPTNCNPMQMMVRSWFTKRSSATRRLAFGGYLEVMANNIAPNGARGRPS